VPRALAGVGGPLRTLFAVEGTLRHVLWMNLLPMLVVAFYFADRHRPAASIPVLRPQGAARTSAAARSPERTAPSM
jgi:hypothetical protein